MTMTTDQAQAWIADLLQARIDGVTVHPQGGWTFEAEGIPAYGSSLVKDHDTFDYCLLDTENDEEVGRHNETMMFTRRDADTGETLLIEGHYSRALGDHRDNADATFHGRAGLAKPHNVKDMTTSFRTTFSDRTLDLGLVDLGYSRSSLTTAAYYRTAPVSEEMKARLLTEAAEINRAIMSLLETGDAA